MTVVSTQSRNSRANTGDTNMSNGRDFDCQSNYLIRVKGTLDAKWSDWFDGMTITPKEENQTELAGPITDQASLYGMLTKILDLGLPLLYVERLEER
jgi:hypothetical protein